MPSFTSDEPNETEVEGLFAQAKARLNSGWQQAALMLRDEVERGDLLVAQSSQFVVYSPRIPLRYRSAKRIRFLLGDQPLASGVINASGRAYAVAETALVGTHELSWLPLNDNNKPMRRKPQVFAAIQVPNPSKALLAIDCRWLLSDPGVTSQTVHAMVKKGWQPIWVSTADVDLSDALAKALAKFDLPGAAFLQWPEPDREFPSLGVDFRSSLLRTCFLRLRSGGVQVSAMLSPQTSWQHAAKGLGLAIYNPTEITNKFCPEVLEAPELNPQAGISERVSRINPAPSSRMSACNVEFDNRLARERLLELINNATSEVLIQTYILKVGSFSQWLAVSLLAAARRGVKIRLFVDALYSSDNLLGRHNLLLNNLRKEPNIQAIAADRIDDFSGLGMPELKHRNHRKLVVIDRERALVSGRNIGDEYYTGFDEVPITDWSQAEDIPWLDAHVEFSGSLVDNVVSLFDDGWLANGGNLPTDPPKPPMPTTATGEIRARLISDEGEGDTACLLAYLTMIDAARHDLILVNNFPVVASLASAIRCALARGVRVRFLTGCALARRDDGTMFPGSIAREAFEYLAKRRFEALLLDGAELYEYRVGNLPNIVSQGGRIRPYVHAKVVCVDGQVASIGSANLDSTASYWEREANVLIEDRTTVTALQEQISTLFDQSYKIDINSRYWESERGRREIADRLYPEGLV